MKEQVIDINTTNEKESGDSTKKDLSEDLIQDPKPVTTNKKSGACVNFLSTVFPCLKKVDTTSKRVVYFSDPSLNITNWSNKDENNKYNVITFIPITLFNQFRQFGNLFYLILTITQFFPQLAVGFLFTYIAPLAFVVAVSMGKELYDDINRRIQDKKTNSTSITVLQLSEDKKRVNHEFKKNASELLVGDIIKLNKNERVPADIIVLKTFT